MSTEMNPVNGIVVRCTSGPLVALDEHIGHHTPVCVIPNVSADDLRWRDPRFEPLDYTIGKEYLIRTHEDGKYQTVYVVVAASDEDGALFTYLSEPFGAWFEADEFSSYRPFIPGIDSPLPGQRNQQQEQGRHE